MRVQLIGTDVGEGGQVHASTYLELWLWERRVTGYLRLDQPYYNRAHHFFDVTVYFRGKPKIDASLIRSITELDNLCFLQGDKEKVRFWLRPENYEELAAEKKAKYLRWAQQRRELNS